MHNKSRFQNLLGPGLSPAGAALAIMLTLLFLLLLLVLMNLTALPAQAQTYKVIYNFTGGADGADPAAGLTMDKAGNLYGTTVLGGYNGGNCSSSGCGTVFRLSHKGGGWILTPLYSFQGGPDGANPVARVIFGPDGALYGTTNAQGNSSCFQGLGCGTVFNLRPQARACTTALCPWAERVLYRFSGGSDGGNPSSGDLVFDQAGSLYGTTLYGGAQGCDSTYGCGVVYELTSSHGDWTGSVLYRFTGGRDGGNPGGGVILDQPGNLYGVATQFGPSGQGTIYALTPSGSGWTENTVFDFQGEYGKAPVGSLIFDRYGNLFGATKWDTINFPWYPGTLYEVKSSCNDWMLANAYDFSGEYPQAGVILDAAGNLFGTTLSDHLDDEGLVYKVAPSNGSWTFSVLHAFTGGNDGGSPYGSVVSDANGNLYGTTYAGGAHGNGVVWEITP